jgi:DNA invertase Pin-like site-specific DNA recombinase
MGRLIGYARVSRAVQNLDLQRDALRKAGCERIFEDDGVSGSKTSRPQLDKALAALKPGDTLVVWRLDRFGRSLTHLVNAITDLGKRGIAFRSLHDPIDTTNASGRLVLHMLAALAEFERSLLVERTQAGLEAAKRRGKKLGRRFALTPPQVTSIRTMVAEGKPVAEIAELLRLHKRTVYRYLERRIP